MQHVVRSGDPNLTRRTLVAGVAWSVPTLAAAAAAPVMAASGSLDPEGTLPKSQLRVDFHSWGQGKGGPIFFQVGITRSWVAQIPESVSVPWRLEIQTPSGLVVITGEITLVNGGFGQNLVTYPSNGQNNLPAGTYTGTLTVYAADGRFVSSRSEQVS